MLKQILICTAMTLILAAPSFAGKDGFEPENERLLPTRLSFSC